MLYGKRAGLEIATIDEYRRQSSLRTLPHRSGASTRNLYHGDLCFICSALVGHIFVSHPCHVVDASSLALDQPRDQHEFIAKRSSKVKKISMLRVSSYVKQTLKLQSTPSNHESRVHRHRQTSPPRGGGDDITLSISVIFGFHSPKRGEAPARWMYASLRRLMGDSS